MACRPFLRKEKGDLHKKCLFHSEPTQSVTTNDYAKRIFNLNGGLVAASKNHHLGRTSDDPGRLINSIHDLITPLLAITRAGRTRTLRKRASATATWAGRRGSPSPR